MKKLYEKNELAFALVWIGIYVAGTTLAETLNETVGTAKLFSAIFHIALSAGLLLWVRRSGLGEKYGLFLPRYRLAQAWFFLPLETGSSRSLFSCWRRESSRCRDGPPAHCGCG